MKGKVVVITGATSGIGEVAARELAGMGARIVLVARDVGRGEAVLAQLRGINPGVEHSAHYADLSLLSEMKKVSSEIAAAQPRIDVLINNAGALFGFRQVTDDQWERTFATNHMAYFVLTLGLRERLIGARARIVNTASSAHKGRSIDFDDLQSAKSYSPFDVYGRSKLCNILFTRALAKRLAGTGVTANCLHPGFVATRFGGQSGGIMQRVVELAKSLAAISEEDGARTIIYLASSPDMALASGEYFYKCKVETPTSEALNDADAERLWQISARITGLN